jgi:hypothetical protein
MMNSIISRINEVISTAARSYSLIIEQVARHYNIHNTYKKDQHIEKKLAAELICLYTDHSPKQTPELFASHFNNKHYLAWLLKNPLHPIWQEKNTSPLHIAVRCCNKKAIETLVRQGYPIDYKEKSSQLSAIELLFSAESKNQSRVLRQAQDRRVRHPMRQSIFETLCALGATLTIESLIQIATKRYNHVLLNRAAKHFIKQHAPERLAAIQQILTNNAHPTHLLHNHIKSLMRSISTATIHDKPKYSSGQLSLLIDSVSQQIAKALTQAHKRRRAAQTENISATAQTSSVMAGS